MPMKRICLVILTFLPSLLITAQDLSVSNASLLKYVIYDFDGLDIGATDLPDGDYSQGDIAHMIAANPLNASPVIGDRVLKLNAAWQAGAGEFGKATKRFLELNRNADKLNFYIYNP